MSDVQRPGWVKAGLWGIPSRGVARVFFFVSGLISVGSFLYFLAGLLNFIQALDAPGMGASGDQLALRLIFGLAFLGSTIWYKTCIDWVDKNDSWS